MFKIEYLMKVTEEILPSIAINVHIEEDGYRIIINRINYEDYSYEEHVRDRRKFLSILKEIKDIYIIKICDGRDYVVKVLVIKDIQYNMSLEVLEIQTPSKIVILEYMSDTTIKSIQSYLNTPIRIQ